MKCFIDTNIFVYATLEDSPHFRKATDFLKEGNGDSGDIWCLSWSVVYEYLRVMTSATLVGKGGMPLSAAAENIFGLVEQKGLLWLQETPDHADHLGQLSRLKPGLSSHLVHDAHIAILMREHDVKVIYTADSDFHRFAGLRAVNPLK